MIRTCVAMEIGQDGAWLVTIIAHTEDAAHYREPVKFWNDQLISITGLETWGRLDRARKRAIAHGWLHYEPGGRKKVGKYWVTIPTQYEGLPDNSVAEDDPVILSTSGDNGVLSSSPVAIETGLKRDQTVIETWSNRDQSVDHSYPVPVPIPDPAASAACPEPSQAKVTGPPSEFVFPTTGKGPPEWALSESKLAEYVEAYPALDLGEEMRKARQWCRDKPKQRKTARGMLSFLTGWLNRAQNQGGSKYGTTQGTVGRPGLVH